MTTTTTKRLRKSTDRCGCRRTNGVRHYWCPRHPRCAAELPVQVGPDGVARVPTCSVVADLTTGRCPAHAGR